MHEAQKQSEILLAALRARGKLTTLQARTELDILFPASHVQTLREAGHVIATIFRSDDTGQATPHRVAEYIYMGIEQ